MSGSLTFAMFSRRAWIVAQVPSQRLLCRCRHYLRYTKKTPPDHCSKNQLWPCGPEVLVNSFVSLSVGYLAPHPMCIATCFLLSLSSSETFLFHLVSPVMPLLTPSIQIPLLKALLHGALFSAVWFILIMLQEIWWEIVGCSSASVKYCVRECSPVVSVIFRVFYSFALPSFPFLWMFQRLPK